MNNKTAYSKKKRCKDCGKLISNVSIRCQSCDSKGKNNSMYGISLSGKNNGNYKHGKYCETNHCLDCGKDITHNSKRCKKCYYKTRSGKNHRSYKDGRTLKKYYCQDCGKQLSNYKAKRCRKCASKLIKNKNNHFWKGGITPLNVLIRCSNKYGKWRDEIFKRDNYTCQKCGSKNGNGKSIELNAHHIQRFSKILQEFLEHYNYLNPIKDKYKLLELSKRYIDFWKLENGITLCEDCHNLTKKENYETK